MIRSPQSNTLGERLIKFRTTRVVALRQLADELIARNRLDY